MTSVLQEQDAPGSPAPLALADMRVRFPARVVAAGWPATTANREETLGRLTCAPFVSDVVELLDAETSAHPSPMPRGSGFYRMLHRMGIFEAAAPQMLRELTASRQRTPEELIDRYDLACRPVRDLLVDYLKERQPALDYSSLRKLSAALGGGFWKDLERHHPGISSLRLSAQVAEAWKQRLRSRQKIVLADTGEKTAVTVERISYRQCLTPVRAFYLDLSQWAIEEPGRWASWSFPVPSARRRSTNARPPGTASHAWTRAPGNDFPVLPVLVRAIDERRKDAHRLLQTARRAHPGQTFITAGQTLTRSVTTRSTSGKIWADDPATGKRRDLAVEKDLAFWAWAAVEVLRLTGVRVEELLEISHHSLVQYRLPGTGELVPLLQIVPSKTDTERLLVVIPELADVLSVIIRRIRGDNEAVPLVRHTTVTNACGSARLRCCSSAGSAPTTAGSATARSATCSTPPWPAPV